MGALAPEAANPLAAPSKALPRLGLLLLRCRQQSRNLKRQQPCGSTPIPSAAAVPSSGIVKPQIALHSCRESIIAHSSAAASFDAIPDNFISESSTGSDTIKTGEVRITHLPLM